MEERERERGIREAKRDRLVGSALARSLHALVRQRYETTRHAKHENEATPTRLQRLENDGSTRKNTPTA